MRRVALLLDCCPHPLLPTSRCSTAAGFQLADARDLLFNAFVSSPFSSSSSSAAAASQSVRREDKTGGREEGRSQGKGGRGSVSQGGSSPHSGISGPSQLATVAKPASIVSDPDDLALQNAPKQVFELIGDPRTGVADDVSQPSAFGAMSVDMVHEQNSNSMFWYKYEFAGGLIKESHRNGRLSDHSKNLMYVLRSKDAKRWTVEALATKFRIRRQRVLAILALKELEAHRMEAAKMLVGALSAYACPVHLSHLALHPVSGAPLEHADPQTAKAVLAAAERSQQAGGDAGGSHAAESAAVLDEFVSGGAAGVAASLESASSSATASSSAAHHATFSLKQQVPAVATVTQQLQLQLLEVLEPYDFNVSALKSSLLEKFSALRSKVTATLPTQAGEDGDEDAPTTDPSTIIGSQLEATEQLLTQLLSSVEALLSCSDVLKEEQALAGTVKKMRELWYQQLQQHGGAVPTDGADPDTAAALEEVLREGSWHGPKLMSLMLGLPLEVRQLLITSIPSVSVELNSSGVDLQALVSSSDYLGPGTDRTAGTTGNGSTKAKKSIRKNSSLLPFDLFGFHPTTSSFPPAAEEGTSYGQLANQLGGLASHLVSLQSASQSLSGGVPNLGSPAPPTAPDSQVAGLTRLLASLSSADGMLEKLKSEGEDFGGRRGRGGGGSKEDYMTELETLHEVDPTYPERVERYEAVMQLLSRKGDKEVVRQLVAELEGAENADPIIKVLNGYGVVEEDDGQKPYDAEDNVPAQVLAERALTNAEAKLGQKEGSWDLMAAYLDTQVAGKVYHRGSGERHLVRLPSFPAFEGYSLTEFDSLEEGELSQMNRLVAQREEAQMVESFQSNLLFNLGLRGEALHDSSKAVAPPNLDSGLGRSPLVVYALQESSGETVYPPLYVVGTDGVKRPLNEQELVFQERRHPAKQVAYQMRQIKRKPELV